MVTVAYVFMSVTPFAILGMGDATTAAMVAGLFSMVNLLLNWKIIRTQATVKSDLTKTERTARKVAEVVQLRKGDLHNHTPPEGHKRVTD